MLKFITSLSSLSLSGVAATSIFLNGVGDPHVLPLQQVEGGVKGTINVDPYVKTFGDECVLHLRGYNEGTEPLIRVDVGDTLHLAFFNKLEPDPHWIGDKEFMNTFRFFNTTNVHTHGLHISPYSPQDNVLLEIPVPGGAGEFDYAFQIGDKDNQLPGTHWYHAHVHGATNVQVQNGLVGMLIVNDDPSTTPQWIQDMPEIPMLIRSFSVSAAQQASNQHKDHDPPYVDELFEMSTTTGCAAMIVMVNGEVNPTATVVADQWTRLRMVNAGSQTVYTLQIDDRCEIWFMALDGIYLEAPQPLSGTDGTDGNRFVPMASGNRVDLAMKCTGEFEFQLVSNPLEATCDPNAPQGDTRFCDGSKPEFGGSFQQVDGDIMKVVVGPSQGETTGPSDGPWFSPEDVRPLYLQDLREREVDGIFSSNIFTNGFSINGRKFPDFNKFDSDGVDYQNKAMWKYPINKVSQVQLGTAAGIGQHPYHQHVVPFQVQELVDKNAKTLNDAYGFDLSGVWFDNILVPSTSVFNIRQVPDFPGTQIIHCHFLGHEDQGMMAYAIITDNECGSFTDEACCMAGGPACGAVQDVNRDIDPEWPQAAKCVCAFDAFCCNNNWDAQCIDEAKMSCALQCAQ